MNYPEIRVERRDALVARVLYIREDGAELDLTELFRILEIRRVVAVSDLPRVEVEVIARLVEIDVETA